MVDLRIEGRSFSDAGEMAHNQISTYLLFERVLASGRVILLMSIAFRRIRLVVIGS